MLSPHMASLMQNPGYLALWEKAQTGFREISGSGWESRADYRHFWQLARNLHAFATGKREGVPTQQVGSLAFMFAGHAGRTRKGLRKRPYFHHVLMVVYLAWLLKLDSVHQQAAIHHDDLEDVPDNLDVTCYWVGEQIRHLAGERTRVSVLSLTNVEDHPGGKHAGQLEKMAKIPYDDAILKLLDRLCNLYDMRYDKPKDFGPERIRQECRNALELVDAMPRQPPDDVLALLAFTIDLLLTENNLVPAE